MYLKYKMMSNYNNLLIAAGHTDEIYESNLPIEHRIN